MGMLDGLLSNPVVTKALFGQLKGLFKEKNLEFIALRLDADGEVELEMHQVGESRIVTYPESGDRPAMDSLINGLIANRTVATPDRLSLSGKKGKKGGKNA